MSLTDIVRKTLRKPAVKLGSLLVGGSLLFLPSLKAQEVNTSDSLLWKKQAIEQQVINPHNQKPLSEVKTTYSLLDTLNAPDTLRSQTFLTDNQGEFKDSVWTQIVNPDYISPVGIAPLVEQFDESLKLLSDGSQFQYEGVTAIHPEILNIFSATGKKVFEENAITYDPSTHESQSTFSLANLTPGFYILNLNNNPAYSLKFIKTQNGLLQPGSTKTISNLDNKKNVTSKSLSLDESPMKRYARSFENTRDFVSFPKLTDTISIPYQDNVFQTTTQVPDVTYVYSTFLKGTPGATFNLSFQGNDTTNFSIDALEDSLVVIPQVVDKDEELLLRAKENKIGYDDNSASWLLPFGQSELLELYLAKTLLPHSFSGNAFAGTQLTFTLPDTTIFATADEHNTFHTDTVWRADSTFQNILGYAVLDPYPAITDTFDANFGTTSRDYFVDTTMNGFNLIFKGVPKTELEVENIANNDMLFSGTIAQDSAARVPGYSSLEDVINVSVSASLPWFFDSTFTMSGVLPGTTSQEIYLRRKQYDFDVELTTTPQTMVTGTFGNRDIDTVYADTQGKLRLPHQQFSQPDSLQEINLKLEKEFMANKQVSFVAKAGLTSFETYLNHLFYSFDVGIHTQSGTKATGTLGGKDIGEVYADANGLLWIPQQQFEQPDSLQGLAVTLKKDFFANKFISKTMKPDTTLFDAFLDHLYYSFVVGLITTPNAIITGTFDNQNIGTLHADAQGHVWLPTRSAVEPDSLKEVSLAINKDDFYTDSVSFTAKPDTTLYEDFLTPYQYANLTVNATREDGKSIDSLVIQIKNLLDSSQNYSETSYSPSHTLRPLLLSKTRPTPFQLNVSLANPPDYASSFIDTVYLQEGDTSFATLIPVVTQLMTYTIIVKDGITQQPIQGAKVRAISQNGDLWASVNTDANGVATIDSIRTDTICRFEWGFKGNNSPYFANWNELRTPQEILSKEEGSVDLPLVMYKRTQAVPGTYDNQTQQSDSVTLTSDEIRNMFQYVNLELAKHQPVLFYIRFINNEPVDTNKTSHKNTLATIDSVVAKGNRQFGTDNLVKRVKSMYTLTSEDIARYTMQPNVLQDSIISMIDYGSSYDFLSTVVTTPEGVTGMLYTRMGNARNENALTRLLFGDLMGMREVFDRSDSYMSRLQNNSDPINPSTPKDRAIAHLIFCDGWDKFYYKTATFDITRLKDTMFDWVNDK